jgi:hypothetical protein
VDVVSGSPCAGGISGAGVHAQLYLNIVLWFRHELWKHSLRIADGNRVGCEQLPEDDQTHCLRQLPDDPQIARWIESALPSAIVDVPKK